MKIKYDNHSEGNAFEMPGEAIDAIIAYAVAMSKAQAKANPDNAYCWTHFSFSVDDNFQPSICFGGDPYEAQIGDENHSDVYEVATGMPWVSRQMDKQPVKKSPKKGSK